MNGTELITAERARQVSVEGWTPEHDREHSQGEMAMAAACYASPVPIRAEMTSGVACGCRSVEECTHNVFGKKEWRDPWPWDPGSDKRGSHDRVRQLAIAGALIAAEIDRLQGTVPAAPAPHSDRLEWRLFSAENNRTWACASEDQADRRMLPNGGYPSDSIKQCRVAAIAVPAGPWISADALPAPVEAKPHPDTERFDYWFGQQIKIKHLDINEYLRGVREGWTVDKWRAWIDAARKASEPEETK